MLFYRDNADPVLNCVEQCENAECTHQWREFYYEEPADAEIFRKFPTWEECYMETAVSDNSGRICVTTGTDNNTKRADALFLSKYHPNGEPL
jgi:hypothetical protein